MNLQSHEKNHENVMTMHETSPVDYFFLPARFTAFFAPVFLAPPAFFLVEPFGLPRPLALALGASSAAAAAAAAAAGFLGEAPFLAAMVNNQLLKLRLRILV